MTAFSRKVCKGPCGRELSVVHSFYHARTGYMSICKECHKANVRANRELKAEYYRAKAAEKSARPYYRQQRRAYAQTPRGREVLRASRARYRRWKVLEQSQSTL